MTKFRRDEHGNVQYCDAEGNPLTAEAQLASIKAHNRDRVERHWEKRIRAKIAPEIEKLRSELAEMTACWNAAEDECVKLRAALALAEQPKKTK